MGYISLFEMSGLNILLALSVYATFMVGQFSLAQVGFWSIGAYVTGMLTSMYGLPLLPALVLSAAFCAVIGIILGYPSLRIRGIYLALATIAFAEVVRVFFHNFVYQREVAGRLIGPDAAMGFRSIRLLTTWQEILICVIIAIAAFAWLERSRIGLSARAIREDETAAASAGINVVAVKVGMFAFGAAVAGVGGGLYATYISFVNSDNFGFHLALISIFYVAVGGTGWFLGPVLGAIALTILPEALRFMGDFRMVGYGIVVLVVAILFPKGLLGAIDGPLAWLRRRRAAARRLPVQEGQK